MRCKSCDVPLTDAEATRKSSVTKEYLDMCNKCLGTISDDLHESLDPDDPLWDEYPWFEDLDPDGEYEE